MNPQSSGHLTPHDLLQTLYHYRKMVIVPAIAGVLLAAAYALLAPRNWRAAQALIVRPEAAGLTADRLGKFSDLSEMKTLQETILELAKSRHVITATLKQVGKPRNHSGDAWPTLEDVDDFRDLIDITPPGGAEFGKTEIFYLAARDTDRQRAKELVAALCQELEDRMQQVRNQRAGSMIAELERGVSIAKTDLQQQTARLAALETNVGADLPELRVLVSDVGGTSEAAQQLRDIEAEIRANAADLRSSRKLVALVQAAQDNPAKLAAMPNRLLESQPALFQLKQALVDAQVNSAATLGLMTASHPLSQAALGAEQGIRKKLKHELDTAVAGLEFDVQFRTEREQELQERKAVIERRLGKLAASRAEYASLIAAVDDHTQLLEEARGSLAEARAKQAGARSASVIARIDGVEAGTRPIGLGRLTTVAAGGVAGLLVGLGLVFLFAEPVSASVPRAIDQPAPAEVTRATTTRQRVPARTEHEAPYGLFRGMSLSDAIAQVERQFSHRN